MSVRGRVLTVIVGLAVVIVWLGIVRIGATQRDGPVRFDYQVADRIPVSLYLPGELDEDGFLPQRKKPDLEPPVVIVAHGFAGDRRVMRTICEALAKHGYAALALDFRGHGSNRDRFGGDVADDLITVMDSLAPSPWFDEERVALLGHSMGGGAVIGAAASDDRPLAVIAISGSRAVSGDEMPNTLLLVAEGDSDGTHEGAKRVAERIAGGPVGAGTVEGGTLEPGNGSAVRLTEIEGADHLSILNAQETITQVIDWLDGSFDPNIERGSDALFPAVAEPPTSRFGIAVLPLLAAFVVIAGIGYAAGRAVPVAAVTGSPWAGLGLLVLALVIAAPIVRVTWVASFLPLEVIDGVASYQLVAAGILAWPAWIRLDGSRFAGMRRALPAALAAFAAIYVVLAPLLSVFHRVTPTPERAVAWVLVSVLFLPFFAVVESLVRRGPTWLAAIGGVLGRTFVLVALFVLASRGFLPGVVLLVVPILIAIFVAIEVFAVAAYAAGRNNVLIAMVESAWLGWLVAVALPITI